MTTDQKEYATSSPPAETVSTTESELTRAEEINEFETFENTMDEITASRVEELVSEMNSDISAGGTDLIHNKQIQHLLF